MATWSLSPQYKKSAVEKMFFYKEGKVITIEQGYRWATFKIESDVCPMSTVELKNDDGYELDGDWEMWDMIDGCWIDIEAGNNKTTEEDVEAFSELWDEDSFEGVESAGWSQDDCEYYYHGPLVLTNEDTGEEFKGEPDEPVDEVNIMEMAGSTQAEITPELQDFFQEALGNAPIKDNKLSSEDLANMSKELEQEVRDEQAAGAKWPFSPPSVEVEEPELTDWFPVSVKPVRVGVYEILTVESINWPYPNKGLWDGKKWNFLDHTVTDWRGLAKDPSQ